MEQKEQNTKAVQPGHLPKNLKDKSEIQQDEPIIDTGLSSPKEGFHSYQEEVLPVAMATKPSPGSSAPILLHKLTSLSLGDVKARTGYTASHYVAFGLDSVVLGDRTNKKLVKFTTQKTLAEVWRNDIPQDFTCDAKKHISHSVCGDPTLICQSYNHDLVMTFNMSDFTHQQTFPGQPAVRLQAALPNLRILYVRKVSDGIYSADVYSLADHTRITTLAPPRPYASYNVSACCHANGNHGLAVVETKSQCLDLYDSSYVHQRRIDLTFKPWAINSVCATGDYVVVIGFKCNTLYLYNWQGEELQNFSGEELGLLRSRILGVGGTRDGGIVLAAGAWDVDSLHLFKLTK